jgi:CHASE2 domain-containing sensor protein
MKKLWQDWLFATVFVFVVMGGIYRLSQIALFNVFDPLGKALGDMEITDITFTDLRLETPPEDTVITLINVGYLSRAEIAQQVNFISQFKPRVIGIDVRFVCENGDDPVNCPAGYDTLSNLMLGGAIAQAGNVVLVSKVAQSDSLLKANNYNTDLFDSIIHSHPMLTAGAIEAHANLDTRATTQEDLKECRRVWPKITLIDGTEVLAFSTQVAMLYDSAKTKAFLARGNKSEVINYRGNGPDPHEATALQYRGAYRFRDWDQLYDTNTYHTDRFLRDKIVLLGFMGSDIRDTSWDDKFFTPLNVNFAGRSRPDMYGVVVHANIISMILSGNFVNEMATWQKFALAFLVVYFNIALFWIINRRLPLWFDGLALLLQLTQIVLLTVLMMLMFDWYNFKLDLTIALLGIALSGTCFEMYFNLFKVVLVRIRAKRMFTNKKDPVLTATDSDIS